MSTLRNTLILAVSTVFVAAHRPIAATEFVFTHENVMGTSMELHVRADDEASASGAEAFALGEIDRLTSILSTHDPRSQFRRLQDSGRNVPVVVSPALIDLLRDAEAWRTRSGGAFDARVQRLSRLWAKAATDGAEPDPGAIAGALEFLRSPAYRVDPIARTVVMTSHGPLTLDAIAKGYIVERACERAMAAPGVRGLVLNVGGDLRVAGEATAFVDVVDPRDGSESAATVCKIAVRDRAIATSGRAHRGWTIAGRRYSHILDPRTGRPVEHVAGATVVAPRSADADALATILNVLEPAEGLRLTASVGGAECLITAADGRTFRSPGWRALEPAHRPPGLSPILTSALVADPKAGGAWGDTNELVVDFEIAKPESTRGRYRRPYVAVWVENPEGYPVRNLLLWVSQGGAGPDQWVPGLKRWHPADKKRRETDPTDVLHTKARSTRPPGQYSVTWDGKDDKGKPRPAGSYTVCVDAAREHGTSQSLRKAVEIGDAPFTVELGGGVEIKSATVTYRRKGTK